MRHTLYAWNCASERRHSNVKQFDVCLLFAYDENQNQKQNIVFLQLIEDKLTSMALVLHYQTSLLLHSIAVRNDSYRMRCVFA